MDEEQFAFIKTVIDDCDYYILIVANRYGSLASDGLSYTEKEYDYAVSKKIPVLSFLHKDLVRYPWISPTPILRPRPTQSLPWESLHGQVG